MLIEIERSAPIICDRGLYRELCKQAIARAVDELAANVAAKATGARGTGAKRERTPREELDVEHRANLRELSRQAHGVNFDLGAALLNDLAIVARTTSVLGVFFADVEATHLHRAASSAVEPEHVLTAVPQGLVAVA